MTDDEQINDIDVSAEELTDLAFGMFTIFVEQSLSSEGKQLYSEIETTDDMLPRLESFISKFSEEYPMLAVPLEMFGSAEDILAFYQCGEAILPTRTRHTYWIQQAKPGVAHDACGAEEAGKWLIFLPPTEADEAWIKIRDATVAGRLGIGAKVSTARENEDSRDDRKVIYVFTANWEDESDVMRVREELKNLGFTDRIGYKRNLDTYAGEYREKGKRVTYYSV
ncbi:MAG TPA: DUF1917 domain-containing protein [Methanocorpusculum sp.]|nr:DUF1917 domain-containing protein [Methanocorpusculum sp.]HJJ39729.1 DUF1917 domain-containing protein [Methanocorpusculum sp.]HJJ49338.1 DUF1917 domain-containing protein [Methanocorpusculum sp.]HJJ56618.1 DUF1917 domain-containing protein [Methanocorpusculum sp.]